MAPERRISYSRLMLLFASIGAVSAILVALEWMALSRVTYEDSSAIDMGARFKRVEPQLTVAPAPEAFSHVVNQNLFDPNRGKPAKVDQARQIPSQAPTPPLPVVPELRAQLVAVVLTPDTTIALIETTQGQPAIRLTIGQEINGWRLTSVKKDRAEFVNGKATKLLLLRDALPKEGSINAVNSASRLSWRFSIIRSTSLCQS